MIFSKLFNSVTIIFVVNLNESVFWNVDLIKFSHGHYLHTTETVRSNVNFSSLLVLLLLVNGQVLKPGSYNVNGNINVLADGSITTNVQMRPGKGGPSLVTQSSSDSEGNFKRINSIITELQYHRNGNVS